MASRISDEYLRDIHMKAVTFDTVRAIAAELLAARARIAKLEQEPPMALVDFGFGVNWKGLHEDMQRLRAERDAARAEVERCVWNMAGISTIACAESLSHYTPGQDWERAALSDVVRLVRRVTEVRAEVERLRAELRRMSEWHDQIADTVPCDVAGPHYGIVEWHLKVLAERDAARAEVGRLRADLREAVELLRLARGRFQSYEECDQDYCADGSDHEPRARMDALLAKHKETP